MMGNVYGSMEKVTSNVPPQGLCQMASCLRESTDDLDVAIMDSRALNMNVEETVDGIIEHDPDILGMSLFTSNLDVSSQVVLQFLGKSGKKPLIIAGGPHPTFYGEHFIEKHEEFDLGVIGEGERTIVEIYECFREQGDLKRVNGIIYNENGNIVKTEKRKPIENLDTLPLPSWDLLPELKQHYRLTGSKVKKREEGMSIITSRGCPGTCNFCNPRGLGNRFRCNSAAYMMKMVDDLYRNFGIRELYIQDDMFTAKKENVIEFCSLLQRSGFNIPWSCNSRVDFVDRAILLEMKKAGCWQIGFGLESGSQKILDTIKKRTTVEQNLEATIRCKEVGMEVMGLFMIGCFNETEKTLAETLNFINRAHLTDLQVTFYTPLPGTVSWKKWPDYGHYDENTKIAFHTEPTFVPFGLTEELLKQVQKKLYLRFYMKPRILFRYFINSFKPGVFRRSIQTLAGFINYMYRA